VCYEFIPKKHDPVRGSKGQSRTAGAANVALVAAVRGDRCGHLGRVGFRGREDLSQRDDVPETELAAGQDLRIALDHLVAGRLYLFSYPDDQGRRIRFVVQRTSEGTVHTNMASCQACYRSAHPHYAHNGQMICGMCKQPMHSPDEEGLTLEQKQCPLVSLQHSMRDNEVVVSAQSVVDQSRAMESQ
jgi:uncharacterized membrane protein